MLGPHPMVRHTPNPLVPRHTLAQHVHTCTITTSVKTVHTRVLSDNQHASLLKFISHAWYVFETPVRIEERARTSLVLKRVLTLGVHCLWYHIAQTHACAQTSHHLLHCHVCVFAESCRCLTNNPTWDLAACITYEEMIDLAELACENHPSDMQKVCVLGTLVMSWIDDFFAKNAPFLRRTSRQQRHVCMFFSQNNCLQWRVYAQ